MNKTSNPFSLRIRNGPQTAPKLYHPIFFSSFSVPPLATLQVLKPALFPLAPGPLHRLVSLPRRDPVPRQEPALRGTADLPQAGAGLCHSRCQGNTPHTLCPVHSSPEPGPQQVLVTMYSKHQQVTDGARLLHLGSYRL